MEKQDIRICCSLGDEPARIVRSKDYDRLFILTDENTEIHSLPLLGSVAGLVLIATVLPYLFYTRGLAGVESGRAAILASVEPIVAALVGIAAFGEPLSLGVVLGLACILATVYLLR